jgi:hypothetical protein
VSALGLAVLPALAIERPVRLSSTADLPRPIDSRPSLPEQTDVKGSFTLKFDKFSVTLGNEDQ